MEHSELCSKSHAHPGPIHFTNGNHRMNPPSPYKGDPNPTKWLIKLKIYFMVNPQFTEEDKVLVAKIRAF